LNQKRKVGRPKVGRKRDYRMSDLEYQAFITWAKERGLVPSQVIRELVRKSLILGLIEETKIKSTKELKEND